MLAAVRDQSMDGSPAEDAIEAARAARLRYISDQTPGIRRRRAGRGFTYTGPRGERVTDAATLRRIRALAIPPAWTDVWICPTANGHIQATGRDARGRKQYRYHARWREVRDEAKYGRLLDFGTSLPRIRRRTEQHLALPGLPREKVLATVVRLLETTLIRVGNEEYARVNGSVGLTTMRDEHAEIDGSRLRFTFRGKSGIAHGVDVRDRRLARLVKRCQDLPGKTLFQYVDDQGDQGSVDSGDVNDYLRAIAGEEFTAKDFRTWAGTVMAVRELRAAGPTTSDAEAKSAILRAIERTAERLANTPAVCRACYVHPAVLDAYRDGSLFATGRLSKAGLDAEEARLLALLRRHQGNQARGNTAGAPAPHMRHRASDRVSARRARTSGVRRR